MFIDRIVKKILTWLCCRKSKGSSSTKSPGKTRVTTKLETRKKINTSKKQVPQSRHQTKGPSCLIFFSCIFSGSVRDWEKFARIVSSNVGRMCLKVIRVNCNWNGLAIPDERIYRSVTWQIQFLRDFTSSQWRIEWLLWNENYAIVLGLSQYFDRWRYVNSNEFSSGFTIRCGISKIWFRQED